MDISCIYSGNMFYEQTIPNRIKNATLDLSNISQLFSHADFY